MSEEPLPVEPCQLCGTATEHRVLKERPQGVTLACTECGTVRSLSPRRARPAGLALVVSDGERSTTDRLQMWREDEVAVGDEFYHGGHRLLVTAIETVAHESAHSARGSDIHTLFAKVFDEVELKLTVNEGAVTRSLVVRLDPDLRVHVGDVLEADGRKVAVKTLKSDQNRTLHRGSLLARNIVRAFCDPAPAGTRPGQRVPTRPRGAAAGPHGRRPGRRG